MITLFIGVPGSGKTQAMQDYIAAQALGHRFLVVDRAGEWRAYTDEGAPNPRWRGKQARLPIVQVSKDADSSEDGQTDLKDTGIYLFGYPWEGIDVAQLCVSLGNCVYVDDEIDLLQSIKDGKIHPCVI